METSANLKSSTNPAPEGTSAQLERPPEEITAPSVDDSEAIEARETESDMVFAEQFADPEVIESEEGKHLLRDVRRLIDDTGEAGRAILNHHRVGRFRRVY